LKPKAGFLSEAGFFIPADPVHFLIDSFALFPIIRSRVPGRYPDRSNRPRRNDMALTRKIPALLLAAAVLFPACASSRKAVSYTKRNIPAAASVAIIIDSPNDLKNIILSRFLKKGFRVQAVNAADLYSMRDIFDVRDLKRISYTGSDSIIASEKAFNNIFKLHLYNYEVHKAEMLGDMRKQWGVQYLVLLQLRDWEDTSWARVIDLGSNELIWLENYPTRYSDNLESVVDHFIAGMTGK